MLRLCARRASPLLSRGLAAAAGAAVGAATVQARSDALPAGEGGVLPEYRKKGLTPRAISPLSPPRLGFFSKECHALGVPVRAHASVSDTALAVAADRIARMLRYLPEPVIARLRVRGASFHIIGVAQGTSDLPEHQHMKGVDGGYTGEKGVSLDQRARGMGGVQSSCGEENLIDLDADPRYAGRDILQHEFAHCVMDVGLPRALRQKIVETHRRALELGRWKRADGKGLAYAGSNASEYWAELSMWYFGTHGEFADRERQLPAPGPGGLAEYDPEGFRLLASIYGGTHPLLKAEDPTPTRLEPLEGAAAAAAAEAEAAGSAGAQPTSAHREAAAKEDCLVNVEFDNRGCACAWRLYWLDGDGKRVQYGEVQEEAAHVQPTFPGHVWLLEASDDAAADRSSLRYAAVEGTEGCVAVIARDARCVAAAEQRAAGSRPAS
jgi:hypothetical protein